MPNLSFAGHLAGIATGTLHVYGVLDSILVTDEAFLQEMESWELIQILSNFHQGFVPTPSSIEMTIGQPGMTSLFRGMLQGCQTALRYVIHCAEAIAVIVFGRGSRLNANIQFTSLINTTATLDNERSFVATDSDDEDWNGLPRERHGTEFV